MSTGVDRLKAALGMSGQKLQLQTGTAVLGNSTYDASICA